MSTNRSLNKLEFKAHMSIHNMVPVSEEETHESSNYTRDRFQKKHRICNEDGTLRLKRGRKTLAALLFLSVLPVLSAPGVSADQEAAPKRRSNTNISVDSEDLGDKDFNSRLGVYMDDDKFGIPVSDSSTLGFNEDGDPNLSMRY